MTSPAVRARGLTRTFTGVAGHVRAVDNVDVDIAPASLTVVRGPSGGGKSTLLNLIGLLDRPTSGDLAIHGTDVASLDSRQGSLFRRERMGFLFQDAGLIDPMSVSDNVETPLLYRQTPRHTRAAQVWAALERVGLAARGRSSVRELSGGERQRVGLARALVSAPSLLICDEPTASLDEANSQAIANLLADQARSRVTVICSSHDPIVVRLADRVIEMDRGRLLADSA